MLFAHGDSLSTNGVAALSLTQRADVKLSGEGAVFNLINRRLRAPGRAASAAAEATHPSRPRAGVTLPPEDSKKPLSLL